MELRPSDIRFSQGSISCTFRKDSKHGQLKIGQTLDDLYKGNCQISDIPIITVVKINERWTTADNRRLWIFRHLERLGKCTTIPVKVKKSMNYAKLNSTNDGEDIRLRNDRDPGGVCHKWPAPARESQYDSLSDVLPSSLQSHSACVDTHILQEVQLLSVEQKASESGSQNCTERSSTTYANPSERHETVSASDLTMEPMKLKYTKKHMSANIDNGHSSTSLKKAVSSGQKSDKKDSYLSQVECDTIPVRTPFSIHVPSAKLTSNNGGVSVDLKNAGSGVNRYTRHDAPRRARIDEMSRTNNATHLTSSRSTTSNIFNDIGQLNLTTERSFGAAFSTSSSIKPSLNYQTPSEFVIFGNSTNIVHLAVQEQDGVTYMDPMKIKYTKTHISATFDDGRTLISLRESLRRGMTSSRSVSPLDVHKAYGFYYVIDGNRRLKVFRNVRRKYDSGLLAKVKVTEMEDDEDYFVNTMIERYPNLQLFDILKMGDSVTVT